MSNTLFALASKVEYISTEIEHCIEARADLTNSIADVVKRVVKEIWRLYSIELTGAPDDSVLLQKYMLVPINDAKTCWFQLTPSTNFDNCTYTIAHAEDMCTVRITDQTHKQTNIYDVTLPSELWDISVDEIDDDWDIALRAYFTEVKPPMPVEIEQLAADLEIILNRYGYTLAKLNK